MRNLTNIFKVLLIMLIIFQVLFIPNVVQADAIGDGFSQATDFINNGKEKANQEAGISTETRNNLDIIYNVLLAIGTSLAVIIGGILGIKFMIASAEDKAKIKEALVPYILGCVIIFGAFGIWKLTVTIGNSISSDLEGQQTLQQKTDQAVQQYIKNLQSLGEENSKIRNGEKTKNDYSKEQLIWLYEQNGMKEIIKELKETYNCTADVAMNRPSVDIAYKKIYQWCKQENLLTSEGYLK